jgi:nitroimidazol reductase NimA-like FMN-containing flavoprotein (pyridoxamine 5'-phosphate oxidase superfamily)
VSLRDPSAADGPAMSKDQMSAFLARPLIARLATADGEQPRVLPMWFRWDGASLWMETSATFPNYRILKRNPRAAVTIDESMGGLRLRAVVMLGTIEITDRPISAVEHELRRIYERYLTREEMASVGRDMMRTGTHVILRFVPRRITTWDAVADDETAAGASA